MIRGIVLGLAGAGVVNGLTYLNDWVLKQTPLVGNNMPLSVYGGLILFLLLINPLLLRLRKKLALSNRELIAALMMTLVACSIPGSGLMRTFPGSVILPHWHEKTSPGWQENEIVESLPSNMLVDVEGRSPDVLTGFVQGLARGKKHISPATVPWGAWIRPLSYWLPLILILWVGLIGLALVVHPQWSRNERLPYPIAAFAQSMMPDPQTKRSSIFASRLFWIGAGTVLVIHLVNYTYTWFPGFIEIPLTFKFSSLAELVPVFSRGGGGSLLNMTVYFTPLAFAYFLSADVSFSLGFGPFLYAIVLGVFTGYGISLGGTGYLEPSPKVFLNFGAYVGILFTILYGGRFYYLNVARRALFLRGREQLEPHTVWGARVFLVSMIAFVSSITLSGLEWQLALPFTAMTVMTFVVLSRVLAETGLFFMQSYALPCAVLWGLMGTTALGPRQMLIMFMFSAILLIDPRESLMPFVVNSFKLVDMGKLRTGRAAVLCVLAVVFGAMIAVPVTLYFKYDRGTGSDGWANASVPRAPFESTLKAKHRLVAQGNLETASSLQGWERLAHIRPKPGYVVAFGVSLALVLLCYWARLYFPRWPIHPVLFLVWNSRLVAKFAPSFLMGWLIKIAVVKYGGEGVYRRLKPLVFGLIAGDMLGGVTPIIIGFIYYLNTGEIPEKFLIMPT